MHKEGEKERERERETKVNQSIYLSIFVYSSCLNIASHKSSYFPYVVNLYALDVYELIVAPFGMHHHCYMH